MKAEKLFLQAKDYNCREKKLFFSNFYHKKISISLLLLWISIVVFSCSKKSESTEYKNSDSIEFSKNPTDTISTDAPIPKNRDSLKSASQLIVYNQKIKDSIGTAYKTIDPKVLKNIVVIKNPKIVENLPEKFELPTETPVSEDDASVALDSAMLPSEEQPSVEVVPAPESPKNAVLGFSYFPEIPQFETRDMRVFVKVEGNEKQVKNKIRELENNDYEFTKVNDSSIVCIVKNIETFKKLKIKPVYDNETFKVFPIDTEEEQLLDFKTGNYWHWKIKAIALKPITSNITLLINAETPDGVKLKLAERQVNIKIKIDEPKISFWQKTFAWFDSHLELFLKLIFIPLAIFIFSVIKKKFSKNNNNPENPNEQKKTN